MFYIKSFIMNSYKYCVLFIICIAYISVNNLYAQTVNTIYIPIVFHVLGGDDLNLVSDDKIHEQVGILNDAFSGSFINRKVIESGKEYSYDTIIQFYIADCSDLTGINRTRIDLDVCNDLSVIIEASEPRSVDSFLNIYILSLIDCNLSGFSFNCLTEESLLPVVGIESELVGKSSFLNYSEGFTLVHEIGHFLGLSHPWGRQNISSDDEIEDTPKQEGPYYGCPSFPQISYNTPDIYYTFMDYVDDLCMEYFTPGQMEFMLNTLYNKYPLLYKDRDYAISKGCLTYDICSSQNIFPNPANRTIKILNFNFFVDQNTYIYSGSGELVFSNNINNTDGSIDISNLKKGVYFLLYDSCISKFLKI